VPAVDPANYTYSALTQAGGPGYDSSTYHYYTMKSDGSVICESCAPGGTTVSSGGTWNDWSFSSGKWTYGNKGTSKRPSL